MNIDKIGQKGMEAYIPETKAAGERAAPQVAREAVKNEQDAVSISKAARELQEARKAVQDAPDMRQAKVEAIKKQVQDGTYQVPMEALVEKLMSLFKAG